jgi:hypothetical protein
MLFENVCFITGTAYAGKSTVARLLAERHGGILCGENWHDSYSERLDAKEFPCLTYTRDLTDWHDFIRRSPEAYEAWYDGVSKECEKLELLMLPELAKQGKPVFVDTNISTETLRAIAAPNHVLVMLADPALSVQRFFDRPDADKQFLFRLIQDEPNPEAAMENFRQGLERINTRERYDRFLSAGFPVLLRDENRTVEQTLALAEQIFGLDRSSPTGPTTEYGSEEAQKHMILRPHHGMCFSFYEGKGYSAEFTDHMGRVIRELSEHPQTTVRLTVSADAVCAHCPNNDGGVCRSADKVRRYDKAVLDACGLKDGDELPYEEFAARVGERILDAGLRRNICGDCEWDAICTKHQGES